jgi:hypothetical protein
VDAVEQALAELGKDAGRSQIHDWIKDKYGYDMTLDHISNCKTELAKRGKKKPGPKPQAAALKHEPAKPQAQPAQKESVEITDVLALRGLLDRVGTENLRKLIDAMAR